MCRTSFLVTATLKTGERINAAVTAPFSDVAQRRFLKAFLGKNARQVPLIAKKRDIEWLEAVPIQRMTKTALLRKYPYVRNVTATRNRR